jgi:phosphoribosyl 1,2-cyclic phosphodiesterase
MTDASTSVRDGNPYGGVPSGGITLPPYYRPTPDLVSNNLYYPGQEELGPDEMRISFIGSTPIPVTRSQAGTCIMVELGNGNRFFFDFGSGCMRNIIAMAVPLSTVNDIFFTHLHVDHYADLPYLFAFAPWVGRWKPLRVHGPSGRTPKDGIEHMIEGMKMMTHWHTDSFNACPIGDGYEVEVNEFDFRDDNGVCYDKDGVTVRHWRRSHTKDGASAYRLDWNGLSFVWTGDGRPDQLSLELAKGVDVFVTEVQPDTANLQALKFGMPPVMPDEHDRSGAQRALCGRLYVQQDPAAAGDGHAHVLRRGAGPGDRGRDSPPLPRAVPVRRARRRRRQRHQGCGLDAQGADPGRRQHGASEPERGVLPVRLEPDGSRSQLPESAANDRRHLGRGGS